MSIEERIPGLSAKALTNLFDNATRLIRSGTARQKVDAARLQPLIDAELAQRKALAPAARTRAKKKVSTIENVA